VLEHTVASCIAGKRESRRLLGDVILQEQDIVQREIYPDACVVTTWTIDLHYPRIIHVFSLATNSGQLRFTNGFNPMQFHIVVSIQGTYRTGRTVHQRNPRRSGNHPRDAYNRNDGGSRRHGGITLQKT
jgi:hypothetical protein